MAAKLFPYTNAFSLFVVITILLHVVTVAEERSALRGLAADTKSNSVSVSYDVDVTWIQQTSDCTSSTNWGSYSYTTPINQRSPLFLCIHLSTSNVRIKSLKTLNFNDQGIDIDVVVTGTPSDVTSVSGEGTQYVSIGTILSSDYYDGLSDGQTSTVDVTGLVEMEFYSRRRVLTDGGSLGGSMIEDFIEQEDSYHAALKTFRTSIKIAKEKDEVTNHMPQEKSSAEGGSCSRCLLRHILLLGAVFATGLW